MPGLVCQTEGQSSHTNILTPVKAFTVGWLVVLVERPFETVFQSISDRLPKRRRKRGERIDESKNVQITPSAPTASTVGPCPTVSQIVGRPGTGSLPSTIAPPNHPRHLRKNTKVSLAMHPSVLKYKTSRSPPPPLPLP